MSNIKKIFSHYEKDLTFSKKLLQLKVKNS